MRCLRSLAVLTIATSGCHLSTIDKPVGSSLSSLTFEGRRQSSRYFDHTEFISLNGLAPVPDVGVFYHNPKGSDELGPGHTIGFDRTSDDPSFRLVGWTDSGVTSDDVVAASLAIALVEEKAAAAIRLTVELGAIDARLAQTKVTEAERAALGTRRTQVLEARRQADEALDAAKADARPKLMKPGLIVARWTAKREDGGNLKAGSIAAMASKATSARGGYMVLGEVRVVYLFVGRDYADALSVTDNAFKYLVSQVGITTYLLQARHISYGATLDLTAFAALELEIQLRKLAMAESKFLDYIDTVQLSSYLSAAASLQNQGVVSEFQWLKVPLNFGEKIDANTLANFEQMRLVPELDGDPGQLPDRSRAGWKTVQAIYTRAPFLNRYAADGGMRFWTLFWWMF